MLSQRSPQFYSCTSNSPQSDSHFCSLELFLVELRRLYVESM